MLLDGSDWQLFIHKTPLYEVKTKIECGSVCSAYGSECDMFIHKTDISECHIGTTENSNTNFLTGQTGDGSLYIKIGNEFITAYLQKKCIT